MPAVSNYLDLDLLIEREGDGYRARVIGSPGGQAASGFQLPFSPLELENFLLRVGMSLGEMRRHVRRIDSSDMAEIKTFGGRLFRALFDEQLQPTLVRSLDEARRRQAGLRVRLRLSDAPELADVPWEFLYDTTSNRFLNLSVETPLVRYLELPEPGRPLTVQPPLRVLVMISGPSDVRQLDIELEWSRIKSAVGDLEERGLIAVERLESASLAALQRALRRGQYHILHFVGHGGYDVQAQDGVLLLEGMDGRSRPVSGQDLGTLLHDHRSLRLVILNSCEGARTSPTDPFAGAAQSLVQQGIPAVIAMQFEITDEAAITLSNEFYSALADGYAVDTALGEARKALFASGNELEWGTPVLYMRSPNGRIFRMARQEATKTPAAPPPQSAHPQQTITVPGETDGPAASPEIEVMEPVAAAPSQVERTQPAPTSTMPPLTSRLSLAGAVILLISMALPYAFDSFWFSLPVLLAVAGAGFVGVLALRGTPAPWSGGVLIGLGLPLVIDVLPLVWDEDGFMPARAGLVIGAGLITLSGWVHWSRSPRTENLSATGWMPTAGAVLVGVGTFIQTPWREDWPKTLAEVLGGDVMFVAPLTLLAAWIFFLSLYRSTRGVQQIGQIFALGVYAIIVFGALAGFSTFEDQTGPQLGELIGLIGSIMVVRGTWPYIRKDTLNRQRV